MASEACGNRRTLHAAALKHFLTQAWTASTYHACRLFPLDPFSGKHGADKDMRSGYCKREGILSQHT